MTQPPCPLAEGDRVDHRKFGLGTVVAIDGPPSVGAPRGPGSPPPNAWKVTVACDDPARGEIRVLSTFLTKVASPDARPFVYWDRQWRPLRDRWLQARDAVKRRWRHSGPCPIRTSWPGCAPPSRRRWTRSKGFWPRSVLVRTVRAEGRQRRRRGAAPGAQKPRAAVRASSWAAA